MIQSIYTSVSNANITPCDKKGKPIKSDPIPLLRDKYLGEYRTELERAKVRKNLGIADDQSLLWGSIDGTIEEQKDLINYIESKYKYNNEISEDIVDVKTALNYVIEFVNKYKTNDAAVAELQENVIEINSEIDDLDELIQTNITDIEQLENSIITINSAITKLNEDLSTINVDSNILNWINSSLENSKTIELKDDTLDVIISEDEKNAITISNGIYVKDLTEEVNKNTESIDIINKNIEDVKTNVSNFSIFQSKQDESVTSTTTIGGITQGTSVSQLNGKTVNEILDEIFFPTIVRDLIYPSLYYSPSNIIIKVGDNFKPVLNFIKNDAGDEVSREEKLTYNGTDITEYNSVGTYTYTGTVNYEAGEYLVDNKGQTTNKRIEAGTLVATSTIVATKPWYAGNAASIVEQSLIAFNTSSGDIEIPLSGKATIKLPGSNTTLNSFKVDGGLGYLDVDLTSWTETTEVINNYTYKVWTKSDEYASILPHKINFTLFE